MNILKKINFILVLVIFIAIFLRFYQLGSIPAGFLNDEANAGYDAYSLLLTGKDQWNSFFPLNNFVGFGDFQPPLNRYSLLIPIFLFGLNEFAVRFISALAGVLSVVAAYFLVKKLVSQKAAYFSALLLAVMPWAVGLNRIGHESNLAILFLITALFFGFLQKFKSSLYYSVIFLSLSMYTYSAYILYAPLVLAVILYSNYTKGGYKFFLKPLILFLIIISPIFFQKNSASVRFSQVGLTTNINSIGLINVLNDERGQCLTTFNPVICKITNNKGILFTSQFIKNYLSHFSPNLLYISGTPTQFSILPKRGLDYVFNFLPLILGIAFLLKNTQQKKLSMLFLILFLLSPLPDSLTSDGNYTRSSMMIPFIAIITGLGYYYLFNFLRNNYKNLKYPSIALFILLIFLSAISFYVGYSTYFKNNYSIYSQYGYKDLISNIKANETNFNRIYLTTHLNDAKQYIFYLFYSKYDPFLYQQKKDVVYRTVTDGWISVDRIGKIYFVQNPPTLKDLKSLPGSSTLIISNPVDFPQNIKSEFDIKDKLGNIIFKAVRLSDLLEYIKAKSD